MHAPVLGDLALGTADWLNQPNPLSQELLTAAAARLPRALRRPHRARARRGLPALRRQRRRAGRQDRRPPLGLVHGDYRLDNLLFGDGTCKVVDWQTVSWGPAMVDAAYFIGGGLTIEDRRAHEEELVRALPRRAASRYGVEGFSWERCWDEYRRQTFHGIVMTIAASMVVVRTDRGDDMFMAWLERNAQQMLDLDALALLPEPDAGQPACAAARAG